MFSANLTDILSSITTSTVYTDLKKQFEEGVLDRKTYESLLLNFHQIALTSAMQTAKDMMLSLQEVEIDDGAGGTKKVTLQQAQILGELERNKLIAAQVEEIVDKRALIAAQTATETERKLLIETQKIGFLDNRVIKLTEIMRGLVGEIEAGGLSNPQANWDMLYASIGALAGIASEHPQVGDITVPATPPAPQH